MLIAPLILFFVVGAVVGSFLNVVADRVPAGQSIISPPSHCPNCQRRIASRDLIPIFSYIWLKGRCRYCRFVIPIRSFLVELLTGILFAFLYWHYGLSWDLAIVIVFCCLFIILIVTDLETGILPNKIVYPGMILAFVFAGLGSIFRFMPSFIADVFPLFAGLWIANAAIGGVAGFVILLVIALIFRGGMGWGDVKLAGLIGLSVGFPLILVAIFLAVVTGGLAAIILLLLKIRRRKEAIPFGPFLALAAMLTLFWGSDLLYWYLKVSIFSIVG